MKKVFALIAAFVVLFSITGEGLSGTACECPETAKVQKVSSDEVASVLAKVDVASSKVAAKVSAQKPPSAHAASLHDCHFGHCGFTLKFYSPITRPVDHLRAQVSIPDAAIPTGVRSETLRPPSRA